MLKGLEISEIRLSQLENQGTIGAEYYAPMYVAPFNTLKASAYPKDELSNLCDRITDGDHGSADYSDAGVIFLLSEDVEEGRIRPTGHRHITPEYARTLSRSTLRTGDVLVTKTGVYFGKSAVVPPAFAGANTIAHVGILTPKPTIDPFYLSTFLNSKYGQVQLRRRGIKATRPEIKLVEFQDILVAKPSKTLQIAIRSVIESSNSAQQDLFLALQKALNNMEAALGLNTWRPPEPLTYTYRASEVFASNRLDSGFFHPIVPSLLVHLSDRFPLRTLGSLEGEVTNGRTVPYTDDGPVQIVRSGDLVDLSDEREYLRSEEGVGAFPLLTGDVLISSIGFGSIGKVQVFDLPGRFATVSEVTVVRQSTVNPWYLMFFLRSRAGQVQLERYITGATGQLHLYPRDVRLIQVPILPTADQTVLSGTSCINRRGASHSAGVGNAARFYAGLFRREGSAGEPGPLLRRYDMTEHLSVARPECDEVGAALA